MEARNESQRGEGCRGRGRDADPGDFCFFKPRSVPMNITPTIWIASHSAIFLMKMKCLAVLNRSFADIFNCRTGS